MPSISDVLIRDGKLGAQRSSCPLYVTFEEFDGEMHVCLATRGAATRAKPDQNSQTTQLDRDAARKLFEILRDGFGFE